MKILGISTRAHFEKLTLPFANTCLPPFRKAKSKLIRKNFSPNCHIVNQQLPPYATDNAIRH